MLTSSSTREQFQAAIDIAADGDVIELGAFEFQGPIHVGKPMTLRGTGATIWARGGPTLIVSSKGVRLQNMRLEVTGEDADDHPLEGCALEIKDDVNVILDNVTVRGRVKGLASEEGSWLYPLSLSLGSITPGKDHTSRLHLYVPVPCDVISEIYGVEASPHRLTPGKNEVLLKVDPHLPRDTFVSGFVTLITPYVKRQISVSAHILREATADTTASDSVVFTPDGWDKLGAVPSSKPESPMPVTRPDSEPSAPPPPTYPPQQEPAPTPTTKLAPRTSDRRRFADNSVPISPVFSQAGPAESARSELDEKTISAEKQRPAGTPISPIFAEPPATSDNVATSADDSAPRGHANSRGLPQDHSPHGASKRAASTSIPSQLFGAPASRPVRRLPIYFLLDVSREMSGAPLEALSMGLNLFVQELRSDPLALETAHVSVITFGNTARQVCSLTPLESFQPPVLRASGGRALGAALKLLLASVEAEVKQQSVGQKGDWQPNVAILTCGPAADDWRPYADEVRGRGWRVTAMALGDAADESQLRKITPHVVRSVSLQPSDVKAFFNWISSPIDSSDNEETRSSDAPASADAESTSPSATPSAKRTSHATRSRPVKPSGLFFGSEDAGRIT